MSFDSCCTCGHVFTKEGNDIPHADGGTLEVVHGGGQCRACYLKAGHFLCPCGALGDNTWKYCPQCGKAREENP